MKTITVTMQGNVPGNLLRNFIGFNNHKATEKICEMITDDIKYYVYDRQAHGDFNTISGGSLWPTDGMNWSIEIELS